MAHHHMDNGDAFMRAQRQAMQQAMQQQINAYNHSAYSQSPYAYSQNPYLSPRAWTPGERPEPENASGGLRLLEEFLQRRKVQQGGRPWRRTETIRGWSSWRTRCAGWCRPTIRWR
jgi:hypothetical protein